MTGLSRSMWKRDWESKNPILPSGVYGYEYDEGKVKLGNGTARWSDLSYVVGATGFVIPENHEPVAPDVVFATVATTGSYDDLEDKPSIPSVQELGGAFVTVVNHGAVASTARPAGAASVLWLGTVVPSNMTAADLYSGPLP